MQIEQIYSALLKAQNNVNDPIFGGNAFSAYSSLQSIISRQVNAIEPIKTRFRGFDGRPIFSCPRCKNEMLNFVSHCEYCGQILDWTKYLTGGIANKE